jgi:hypothetical protein
MFAAVKGWPTLAAALLLTHSCAQAAEDPNAAAAALARKTAALAGRGEPVAVSYKNISSLAPAEWSGLRAAFESALRDAGCRVTETAAAEARLTVSETPTQYLLVEEARRGDERQVWIASWDRTAGASVKPPSASLALKQTWRQAEQILDLAFLPAGMLVLSPSKLTLYARAGDSWSRRESVSIANSKPWPRDLRGRVRVTGATFQIFLPGMACNGSTDPSLTLDCRASEAPWVLESGSRGLLLATFTPSRNYFDGRVVTQSGARKTVAPFYSAASVESQGRTLWVMAQTDGRAQIADASLDPIAAIPQWGSDIAGIDVRCGGGSQVIATRAGDSTEPDALQSFTIADRFAAPATAAAILPGPVTALWPSGSSQALAVARDLVSGDYIAYVASVSCAN